MGSAEVLTTLILCGFLGALGQGVRAAVGLKSAATLAAQNPSQRTEFDVAYFTLSLMIGFTAGILAGLAIGLENFAKIDPNDPKSLLAIVAAGYAGTDFIENVFTNLVPKISTPPQIPARGGWPPSDPNSMGPAAVALWIAEKQWYHRSLDDGLASAENKPPGCTAPAGKYCGHFTQVVWSRTQFVGCGKATATPEMGGRTYIVCNYYPAGNYSNQFPY